MWHAERGEENGQGGQHEGKQGPTVTTTMYTCWTVHFEIDRCYSYFTTNVNVKCIDEM